MRFIAPLFTAFFFALIAIAPAQAEVIKSGNFIGFDGKKVTGTATIEKKDGQTILTFSKKFKTSFGPSLFVYLGSGSELGTKLAKLKKRKKAQSYVIPASLDVSSFSKVYIYCDPFNVVFGVASLK